MAINQLWQYIPVISALGKLRQADGEFKASLCYTGRPKRLGMGRGEALLSKKGEHIWTDKVKKLATILLSALGILHQ